MNNRTGGYPSEAADQATREHVLHTDHARTLDGLQQMRREGTITEDEQAAMAEAARARLELGLTLLKIEADHPFWHTWVGVIPCLLYARRVNSSPPRIVRAPDVDALRAAIEQDVARRGRP